MSEKTVKKARKIKAVPQELSDFTVHEHNIDALLSAITRKEKDPTFIVVDLFCGAGGTTTGFARTGGIVQVIACVNHDYKAIKSHWLNHPEVLHFEEDIRKLRMELLVKVVVHYRKLYPNAYLVLWASLECTNFSKAKGGQSRDADSRTLANHLFRYIDALKPEYIQIENVVEFMAWGPMKIKVGKKHKTPYPHWDLKMLKDKETGELGYQWEPISTKNGEDWLKWCKEVCAHGYRDSWKEVNAADLGALTSRNRLFGVFAMEGLPIVWPVSTHAKDPGKNSLFELPLKKWRPVKEVLDFADEGYSIFYRSENTGIPKRFRKDIEEASLKRFYEGLIKHIAGGKSAFLSKYHGGNCEWRNTSVDEPAGTIMTSNSQALVQPSFISKYFGGRADGKSISVDGPAGTIRCNDGQALIKVAFLGKYNSNNAKTGSNPGASVENPCPVIETQGRLYLTQAILHTYHGNGHNSHSVEQPSPTVAAGDGLALVRPKYYIDKQYSGSGNCANHQSIDQPAGTILKNDKHALIHTVPFLDRQFSNGTKHQSINDPAGAILPVPKMNLITPFIASQNYTNVPTSIDEPCPTITANRKWHYLLNPSWGGNSHDIDEPSPVLIARQDKAPLYLISCESGPMAIPVYQDDSETLIKIKEFMVLYNIRDIKMRMLRVPELLQIQGFPIDYHLVGSQADKKKFIGNSVETNVPKAMAITTHGKLIELGIGSREVWLKRKELVAA